MDMDTALREHEDIAASTGRGHPAPRQQARGAELRRLVGRLNSSTCPRAVKVDMPLQAYFRINTEKWASSSAP